MAITSAELVKSYTGASSNAGAQTDPDACLGDYRSSTTVPAGDNNLFADITGDQALSGYTDYRCFVFQNTDAALSLTSAKVYISADDSNADTTYYLCLERPQSSLTVGNAQVIGNVTTAPDLTNSTYHTSGSFTVSTSCSTYATGLVVGPLNSTGTTALAPNELIYVWVKRVISASATAAAALSFTVTLKGDTAA